MLLYCVFPTASATLVTLQLPISPRHLHLPKAAQRGATLPRDGLSQSSATSSIERWHTSFWSSRRCWLHPWGAGSRFRWRRGPGGHWPPPPTLRMAGVGRLPPGKSGRKDVDPWDFWRQGKVYHPSVWRGERVVSQRCFYWSQGKSRMDRSMKQHSLSAWWSENCMFSLRKRERNITFVCQVLEIHLQESPRLDLKNQHIKKKSFPSSFRDHRNSSHPIPPRVPRRKRRISLKRRQVTLAVHRSAWEVATLENEFLGILGVFLVLFCCVTWKTCKKLEFFVTIGWRIFF